MNNAIAVIGIGCYYPGAKTPLELWENILSRRQQFRNMPDCRLPNDQYFDKDPLTPDKTYQTQAAVIDGYEFDWLGKRIPKKTYESTDVVHWLTLDTALAAIADAGYSIDKLPKATSGVIIGNTLTGEFTRAESMRLRWPYVQRALRASALEKGISGIQLAELEASMEEYYKSVFVPITEDTLAGGLANTIAGRVCNYMDIHGGGYIVDGACSSSLLAIKTAASYLDNHEMDLVITGGVDISLDSFELIGFAKTGALTKEEMNVYDKKGKGFKPGEGCGMVVLKRMEDALRDGDNIYAALKGWGVSSDGKGGITAPKSEGQALALSRAYAKASFDPHQLDFIEGHGTGTSVGDKTELAGIAIAVNAKKSVPARKIGMTSFKSIVGHTKAAAGVGAFIKTVIAVNQRIIPPTAGCTDPHEIFSKEAQCLYPVLMGEIKDPTSVLKAGVSAMGFGGINSHVLLESAGRPASKFKSHIQERQLLVSNQSSEIFLISSESAEELITVSENCIKEISGISYAELADYAAHLNSKINYNHVLRAGIVAFNPEDLNRKLEEVVLFLKNNKIAKKEIKALNNDVIISNHAEPSVVGCLFPGQASQQLNMSRVLIERYEWAREIAAKAAEIFSAEGNRNLLEYIFKPLDKAINEEEVTRWKDELRHTDIAQPAITLSSVLWFQLLKKLNVPVSFVTAHSLGELTAFYCTGAYDEATLFKLAVLRGKAMAAENAGTMLSLTCAANVAEELLKNIDGYAVIANLNSPLQTVVSGEEKAIKQIGDKANQKGITTHKIPVSAAFHSKMVAKAYEALLNFESLKKKFKTSSIKVISSVNGKEVEEGTELNTYFAEQVINQVDFINTAAYIKSKCQLLIETGPGRVLSNLVNGNEPLSFPVESKAGADKDLNTLIINLFTRGINVSTTVLYQSRLVRPFIPAYEKKFIVAPLERPFKKQGVSGFVSSSLSYSDLHALAPEFSSEVMKNYFRQRGGFIQEVIKADLKTLNGFTSLSQEIKVPVQNNFSIKTVPTEKQFSETVTSSEKLIYSLISDKTGFPIESLNKSQRLLDDLNMDSIKAGVLISDVVASLNLHGKAEPVQMTNLSIGEIIHYFDQLLPQSSSANTISIKPSSLESSRSLLFRLVEEKTGFPSDTLNENLRLLDDLNMDSIKAGTLIADAINVLQLKGQIEPVQMTNASLGELIQYFDKYQANKHNRQAPTSVPSVELNKNWVNELKEESKWTRSYVAHHITQPLVVKKDVPSIFLQKKIVIVHDADQGPAAIELTNELKKWGRNIEVISFAEVALGKSQQIADHILVLPGNSSKESRSLIQKVSEQLAAISCSSILNEGSLKGRTLTIMQKSDVSSGKSESDIHHTYCSAASFAASIHLELPELKVRVLQTKGVFSIATLVNLWAQELNSSDNYLAASYNNEAQRTSVVYDLAHPEITKRRGFTLTSDDVILVTGGAKGITAECAFAIAEKWGCKMALLGSSSFTGNTGNASEQEIISTLDRYKNKGLTAAYYTCDIASKEALAGTIEEITKVQGKVTVIIHGAGLNKARPASQVNKEEALKEITPKVMGGINLMELFEGKELKFFVGFTSIIGVTGMKGNAWYAFSNEMLDNLLRSFADRNKKTETLTLAYSVWDEIGMGVKMGSNHYLTSVGILSIPVKEGVEALLRWTEFYPGDQQVVVSSKYNGLASWKINEDNSITSHNNFLDTFVRNYSRVPAVNRYIDHIVYYEPNVEVITETTLALDRDDYVKDHIYNGSYLFPTVFGLEAMAQNVALLTGNSFRDGVTISDIRLEKPIVVHEERGTKIRLHSFIPERKASDEYDSIHVSIYSEQDQFRVSHFFAKFSFDFRGQHNISWDGPASVTGLIPKRDLYGNLLFQGEQFHRIESVYELNARHFKFAAGIDHQYKNEKYILGDPFYRDALLQSGQLLVPWVSCLPVYIGAIHVLPHVSKKENLRKVHTILSDVKGKTIYSEVQVFDEEGNVCEFIEDYRTMVLKVMDEDMKVEDLLTPLRRDKKLIVEKYAEAADAFGLPQIVVEMSYNAAFESSDREERHQAEKPLLLAAAKGLTETNTSDQLAVEWDIKNKPYIKNAEGSFVSLSHVQNICLVAGCKESIGIDIENVLDKNADTESLLGNTGKEAYRYLILQRENKARAASLVWSAMEAVVKLGMTEIKNLVVKEKKNNFILLTCNEGEIEIVSIPITLTLGSEKVIAIAFQKAKSEVSELNLTFADGMQKTGKYAMRFHTTFKDCRSLSGKSYFTNFPIWMGKIRELALEPVAAGLVRDLGSGDWGMVTNDSGLFMHGEVDSLALVEGRVWLSEKSNLPESYIALEFEWLKVNGDNQYSSIGHGYLNTTWVKITGHGKVEKYPIPGYFLNFLKTLQAGNNYSEQKKESYPTLKELGVLIYVAPPAPRPEILLRNEVFQTGLDDGNSVGNLYYSNYYSWQARVRDLFLYESMPEAFSGKGSLGELICIHSEVKHLQEAMPFEKVEVSMYLKQLHTNGLILYFEYYVTELSGATRKLAHGTHTAVWVKRDENSRPVSGAIPAKVIKALENNIQVRT